MPGIVAAVDTVAQPRSVLRWAAREAAVTGERFTAVATTDASGGARAPLSPAVRHAPDECGQSVLPLRQAAVTQPRLLPGRALDALVALSLDADLLVLGAEPDSRPWTPHDLPARVLARAACPVAVVTGNGADDASRVDTGCVAVGIDGSAASSAALRWAVQRAERTGGVVIAVAASLWTPDDIETSSGPSRSDADAAALTLLHDTVRHERGASCVEIVDDGHPAEVLLDMSRFVDLVVVGNTGVGFRAGHQLGSVSRRVAQRACCPVVVVHDTASGVPARPADATVRATRSRQRGEA